MTSIIMVHACMVNSITEGYVHISCTTGYVQKMPHNLHAESCIVYVALCCISKCAEDVGIS